MQKGMAVALALTFLELSMVLGILVSQESVLKREIYTII